MRILYSVEDEYLLEDIINFNLNLSSEISFFHGADESWNEIAEVESLSRRATVYASLRLRDNRKAEMAITYIHGK